MNNIESVVRELCDHLKAQIPRLKVVVNGFPDPTQPLLYPSISVMHQGAPELLFDVAGATSLSVAESVDTGTVEDPIIRSEVVYKLGRYDFRLQLDIWATSKMQRETLYQDLFEVLNPNIYPMGLTLTLTEYFQRKCHYQVTGYNNEPDGEQSSQKGTWRTIVDVLATCDAIRTKKEYIMETLETTLETPDTIEDTE